MTSPEISLQDRLLPELDRDLLMGLAELLDGNAHTPASFNALTTAVPAILRTGRTLRYIEAVVSGQQPAGWLSEKIKTSSDIREECQKAMLIGSDLLASHYANEMLDGDQPRIKAFGVLMKQQADELQQIAVKPKRKTSWTDG